MTPEVNQTLRRATVAFAKSLLNEKEATGKNDGWLPLMVQRFIAKGAKWLDNQPWCVCFALFCVKTSANAYGIPLNLPQTASSSQLAKWFKDKGLLKTKPEMGDIAMVKGGPTGHSHTFIVSGVDGEWVLGVDGNYKNAVSTSRRRISECDYGPIV